MNALFEATLWLNTGKDIRVQLIDAGGIFNTVYGHMYEYVVEICARRSMSGGFYKQHSVSFCGGLADREELLHKAKLHMDAYIQRKRKNSAYLANPFELSEILGLVEREKEAVVLAKARKAWDRTEKRARLVVQKELAEENKRLQAQAKQYNRMIAGLGESW